MIGTRRRLGTMQDVLFDEGELVGIVVAPRDLYKHDLLVQVRFLDRGDDLVLFVPMTAEDVTRLAEYAQRPGALIRVAGGP